MTTTPYTFPPRKAEIANSLTHALGIFFSLIVILLVLFGSSAPNNHRFSVLIFALCMMEMYCVSTIYHATKNIEYKTLMRLFDHISIYFLIAGTYTPFILLCLTGTLKWLFFGIIWGIVALGIIYKLFWWKRHPKISLYIYLAMGWIIVFVVKPIYQTLPFEGFMWLMIGGAFYSLGTIFYAKRKPLYNHAIWHFFVLGGSISHFFAVMTIR